MYLCLHKSKSKMKKIYPFLLIIFTLSIAKVSFSQPTVAYDFNMNDCSGNMHHLFSELDSGNVVIMELFMLSCSPCVDAGNELEPMFQNLKATCSNKIIFYHMGYTNSYNCSQITSWVSTNGYTSIPIDSGAIQTAYYGGMGMPTIAVVAGNTHKVLHTTVGYTPGDTAMIADSIRTFFGCSTVNVAEQTNASLVSVTPNPSNGQFTVSVRHAGFVSASAQTLKQVQDEIEVYNVMGKKIFSSSQFQIDISNQPNGIYFLRGKANGRTFSQKIILQK